MELHVVMYFTLERWSPFKGSNDSLRVLLYSIEPPNVGMMKAISSGMSSVGTRVLHKEELGVSETERQIKRRVEEKLQSRKNTSPNDKTTRKTSPTPSSPSPISPPSKVSYSSVSY